MMMTSAVQNDCTIDPPVYVYIYLSNDDDMLIDVFFDDFAVTQTHSNIVKKDDYYPFDLTFNSYQRTASTSQNFKYNGKEAIDDLGLNMLDYGARFYDAALGRWNHVDPLSNQYEGISPYSYGLNDPINTIDPDGRLVLFVNGFESDKLLSSSVGLYTPNRAFSKNEPQIGGKSYWIGLDDLFMDGFKDHNALYTSGQGDLNAGDRFDQGTQAGNDFIDKLESGEITLSDDETIKIVGHSHGGAYAAGMLSVLVKHKKYGNKIDVVHYVAPHQPTDFNHTEGIEGHQ